MSVVSPIGEKDSETSDSRGDRRRGLGVVDIVAEDCHFRYGRFQALARGTVAASSQRDLAVRNNHCDLCSTETTPGSRREGKARR